MGLCRMDLPQSYRLSGVMRVVKGPLILLVWRMWMVAISSQIFLEILQATDLSMESGLAGGFIPMKSSIGRFVWPIILG